MRIFQFLLSSGKNVVTVLVIICLLVIQAWCDLSLPRYTSDIVDVGIMQGGIEDAVPDVIRKGSYETLKIFMDDKDAAFADRYYEAYTGDDKGSFDIRIDAGGLMALVPEVADSKDKEVRAKLDSIFVVPMIILGAAQNPSGAEDMPDINALIEGYQSGVVSREQMMEVASKAAERVEALGDMADTAAVAYIQNEYEEQGRDLNDIQMDYMKRIGIIMILYTLLSALSAITVCLFASYRAADISRNLRRDMFHSILAFSGREMDRFSSASLITRSTNDIQQVQMALVMSMRMLLLAPIMGIGGLLNVLRTHTGMGWIVAVVVGILLLVFVTLIAITMPKFNIMQTLIDRLNLVARETLKGLPVIRAFCKESYEEERFEKANRDLYKTQLFTMRAMSFMFPIMMFIMNSIAAAIVWISMKEIDKGAIQVGDMMAFITYTIMIVMSFTFLSMLAVILPRANVAANRIHEVRVTKALVQDKADGELVSRSPDEWKGRVSFEHVSFRYPDAPEDVLTDISFTAEPGQTTAIIGSTGSGKSTIVNLIPRLFDVTAGSVSIDGVDIRDLRQHDLRALLGVVPQKGILFSGDIASNIRFGADDTPEENMMRAARIAQADDFIEEKEGGYGSEISQGGGNVSGGQKQRLAIARAINKEPKVYIFDDSFSALDYRTDMKLRKALAKNVKDAAIIIVAQRIATILRADKIIVLEDGAIVGEGDHRQLMESCEVYREIAMSQLNEEELAS